MFKKVLTLLIFILSAFFVNAQMILEYNTALSEGTTISLPFRGDYDVAVDWGDGEVEDFKGRWSVKNHTYDSDGIYIVSITGTLSQFGNGGYYISNAEKLVKCLSFGDLGLHSLSGAFMGATNLIKVPDSIPKTITDLSYTFYDAVSFNSNVENWDVSNVITMKSLFAGAVLFNQDISHWDVGSVTNMSAMFCFAHNFNQDIGDWNVGNVIDMSVMFREALVFNQDIGDWNVCNVKDMSWMFIEARAFDQYIGDWDVSNVKDMSLMFRYASSFNQDLGSWNVSNVTNMKDMFRATLFNQDISAWDVSNVTNMEQMFDGAKSFNQDLSNWDIIKVSNMIDMFQAVTLSTTFYNNILVEWSKKALLDGVYFDAGLSKYSTGEAVTARQNLIDNFGWIITDGGISDLPAIQTDTITEIEFTSAISGGIITEDAGSAITSRGIVWNTSKNPTLTTNSGSTSNGTGTGIYSSSLTGITAGETYYVRAYATNGNGTEYGNQLQFIPQQEINLTGSFNANSKVYDGKQNAELTSNNLTINNLVTGNDDVSLSNIDLFFNDKNVGQNKIISIKNVQLLGSDSLKYNVNYYTAPTATANITSKNLTISDVIVENKIYDGTNNAIISTINLEGVLSGDSIFVLDTIASFVNKNIGTSKAVTSNITLTGADTINYTLTQPTGLTADITKKELTVTSASADNKVYDGTTITTISGATLEGVVSGDDLTISDSTATFDNKNAGTSKTVTSNITLTGTDTINYSLTQPTGLTADITKKELTIINALADNKVYDGTIATTISGAIIVDVVSGDDLIISDSTATFDSKNVGTSKTVTSNITLIGSDTINYSLTQPTGLTADITKKDLTVSNAIAENKAYNGTTTTTISGATLEGVVTGDDLTIADSTATFDSKNAGTSKTVTSNITLTGTDTINYSLTQPTGLTADITKKDLTVSNAIAENKVYNGTTTTTISGATLEGVVTGDDLIVADSTATFDSKNVGTSKTVASNITLTGADTINYSLTQPTGLTANITKKELTITDAVANNKIYDGSTSIEISNTSLSGLISGDVVAIKDTTGIVDDKNVGTSKTVNADITLSGADTINYYLTQPTGLTVDITPKTITVSGSFTVNDKDYDETTDATIKDSNLVLDGVISPDIVTLSILVLNFTQAEIGNDITVTITEAEISGDDAQNYELSLDDAPTTTANINEHVGVNETSDLQLSVYPNPFDNQLTINALNNISSISITTITGKLIMCKDIAVMNNINVSQLPQGVYLVNVILENNQSKTFKMIKK